MHKLELQTSHLKLQWWAIGVVLALLPTFFVRDAYLSSILNLVAIAAVFGVSMRFVMLMGEFNFAIPAFVAIGAYSVGAATAIFQWPFVVALIVGGVLAAAVSVVFGYITLRVKGPYFFLIGFAFAEAARILLSKTEVLGGTSGMIGIFLPQYLDHWVPTLVTSVAAVLILMLYAVERSDFGKIMIAIRDNENVARTVGINVLFCKVLCFALASFVAGLAGGLHAFVNNVIAPDDFSFLLAAFALAYVKVGGESVVTGPIIGAVFLVVLSSFALGLGGEERIFYGASIFLAVLLLPDGIVGIIKRVRSRLSRS